MTDATRIEATSCCADGDYAAITDLTKQCIAWIAEARSK